MTTPPAPPQTTAKTCLCDVCSEPFPYIPDSDHEFVCDLCHDTLTNCPKCNSEDVGIDWFMRPSNMSEGYEVKCGGCGHSIEGGMDEAAKIYQQWTGEKLAVA